MYHRIKKYGEHWNDISFILLVVYSFLLLLGSLCVNYVAGVYATNSISNSVTDIVLSNVRAFDVDGIFVYGSVIFWIVSLAIVFCKPKRIPFVFKSVALFVIIRSVFISLTHIGPFPTEVHITSTLIDQFTFGGDLFFSGHTGIPFLLALIFWHEYTLRILFLCASVLFGVVVLLGHIHYSIDVLSAFFITYSIYRLAEIFFAHDKALFLSEHS